MGVGKPGGTLICKKVAQIIVRVGIIASEVYVIPKEPTPDWKVYTAKKVICVCFIIRTSTDIKIKSPVIAKMCIDFCLSNYWPIWITWFLNNIYSWSYKVIANKSLLKLFIRTTHDEEFLLTSPRNKSNIANIKRVMNRLSRCKHNKVFDVTKITRIQCPTTLFTLITHCPLHNKLVSPFTIYSIKPKCIVVIIFICHHSAKEHANIRVFKYAAFCPNCAKPLIGFINFIQGINILVCVGT